MIRQGMAIWITRYFNPWSARPVARLRDLLPRRNDS
jgi:hypothetical protein